jgi:hypothetical protein
MGKTVLHVTKFQKNTGGLGHHIDRRKIPKNADKNLTHLNIEIVKPQGNLQQDIAKRIYEAEIPRKIRDNAVRYVGIIASGSHKEMKKIEDNGDLDQWAMDNYNFMAEKYGKENIIRASLHMDEKTPHIHFGIVPITKDNRLSAKSFFDGKVALRKLQDDYALKMAKYGLERGVPNEKRRHITTAQYYKHVNSMGLTATKILENENAKELIEKLIEIADNSQSLNHNSIHLENERRIFQESERERELKKQSERKRLDTLERNARDQGRSKNSRLKF